MHLRLKSGRAIGYRTSGAGDVVVFLHPIGMNAAFWTPVSRAMTNCRMLAIDMVGHGDSDTPPGEFTLDEMAADTVETIKSIGRPPCVVVGCSMGGMVAQGVAVRAPELVRGLVLLNTSHTLPPVGRNAMKQRAMEAERGMPTIIDATIERWFSVQFREACPDIVEEVRANLLICDPVVHARAWRAISDLDYEAKVGSINCPVLVMTGSADVSTPPAISQALVKLLADGKYREIERAGHMTPLEQPQYVAELINEFVASLEP